MNLSTLKENFLFIKIYSFPSKLMTWNLYKTLSIRTRRSYVISWLENEFKTG